MSQTRPSRDRLVSVYRIAKQYVLDHGYSAEIEWQDNLRFDRVTEQEFLAESAWVVLSSGMREKVIRKLFGDITTAFYKWQSASAITRDANSCIDAAIKIFGHHRKIKAIAEIAATIDIHGFETIKQEIACKGVDRIREFPYMGPTTSYHLAKNLGMDVAKPDRHLLRIALATGYASPDELCRDLSDAVGDRVSVIDLVLWRYATIAPQYVQHFAAQDYAISEAHAISLRVNSPPLWFSGQA
jgi:hypothetical protein